MSVRVHRTPRAGLVALAAALLLGGCSSLADDAQRRSLRALAQPSAPRAELESPVPPPRCAPPPDRAMRLPPARRMPPGSFMERIYREGVLRVGIDQNTLGLGYYNPETGELQGLDIELARAVARAIFGRFWKSHIVYTAISTAQRESAIESGEVDLVASAFSINCERREKMHFSAVYYLAQQRLLVRDDSAVDELADLKGARVCATAGSTSIDNLFGTGVVRYPVELRPDCLVELQEGRVAAISGDDSILYGFELQDPQTKIVGSCINIERYGMAINLEHPEFVPFVNGVLQRIGQAGLARLRREHLPGLDAPTRAEIARCSRAPDRVRAAVAAERLRQQRGSRRWRCGGSVPAIAELWRCGGYPARGASR